MFRRGEVPLATFAVLLLGGAVLLEAQEAWVQGAIELMPCQLDESCTGEMKRPAFMIVER